MVRHDAPLMQGIFLAVRLADGLFQRFADFGSTQVTRTISGCQIAFDVLVIDTLQQLDFVLCQRSSFCLRKFRHSQALGAPCFQLRLRYAVGQMEGHVVDCTSSLPMRKTSSAANCYLGEGDIWEGCDRTNLFLHMNDYITNGDIIVSAGRRDADGTGWGGTCQRRSARRRRYGVGGNVSAPVGETPTVRVISSPQGRV